MRWMVDWVSMRQQHEHTDIVGKNVCIWFDGETGARISEGVGFLSHEGSYSTAVQVRAMGGLVEWSGNPSRWGRPDNVYGYWNLAYCIEQVINPQLISLGLPPFSVSREGRASRLRSSDGATIQTGAVITRIDLCRNLSCGDAPSAAAYLRAASCAVYRGKSATSYPGSVAWGTPRNSRLKMYDKGQEVLDNTNNRSPSSANCDALEFHRRYTEWTDYHEYRQKLGKWLKENGVVRHEVTLGRQALRQMGLRSYDEWDDTRAFAAADERFDSMNIGCSVGLENSFASFVGAGFTERRAAVLSGVVSRWYMREPVSAGISRATWYRYKGDVKSVLGIDLSSEPDVALLNTRVRQVTLTPIEAPSWYRHVA